MANFNSNRSFEGGRGGNSFGGGRPSGNRSFGGGNSYGGGNRGGFGGNRSFGGGNRGFGGRDSGPREMFSAVCDNCGNTCEVPFKPTGNKPVLCSNCFEKSKMKDYEYSSNDRQDRGENRRPERSNSQNNEVAESIKALNSKLDRILDLLSSQSVKPKKAEAKAKSEVTEVANDEAEVKPEAKKSFKMASKVKTTKAAKTKAGTKAKKAPKKK